MKEILFVTLFSVLLFCGCGQQELEEINYNIEQKSARIDNGLTLKDIPKYSSMSDLYEVVYLNNEERSKFEKEKGYKSFHTKSSEIYDSFDFPNAKSVEEIEKFVAENAQYVEIFTNEAGEREFLPKLFYNPIKYVISESGEFYLNNKKYSISEDLIFSEYNKKSFNSFDDFVSSFSEYSDLPIVRSSVNDCVFRAGNITSSITQSIVVTKTPHRMKCTIGIHKMSSTSVEHRFTYSFHQRLLFIWGLSKAEGTFAVNASGNLNSYASTSLPVVGTGGGSFKYSLVDSDRANTIRYTQNITFGSISTYFQLINYVFNIWGSPMSFLHPNHNDDFLEYVASCNY